MKKLFITLMAFMPLAAFAQNDVEAAQKRLEEAQKALEAAKKAVIEAKKESEKTAVTTFNHKKATTKAELEAIKAKAQKAIGALTENKDEKYLAGAVPTIDGKVVFSKTINIPGKNADEVYAAMYDKLIELIGAESSLDQSALVLSNENEHKLGAKIFEYLVFHSNALSLDRALMNYILMITCKDGVAEVEMKHINYEYEKDRPTGFKAPAEELITDKYSLNKKGTKLNRITGKFRRNTIERFESIIEELK